MNVDASQLRDHVAYLARSIGVRLAGSDAERRAAEYIEAAFRSWGGQTAMETFPARQRRVIDSQLRIRMGGRWRSFPGSLFSSTPGTGGRWREAPLVVFESATEYQRRDLGHLRGKAVLHLGTHIESRQHYRRLMAAGPAFLLMVDTRYPGEVPLADGMFPAYTQALGAVPTVGVAYLDAWRWRVEGAEAARLCIQGGMEPAQSQNVIADFPGADPDAGCVVVWAHHDTQADSPGADDNASGVAGILELARVLGPMRRRRGLRFISFGAEEQLSVGAAAYVRAHRRALRREVVAMFNFDSYGSWLGWNELYCNGPVELARSVVPHFRREDVFVKVMSQAVPYADHFPFVAAGVPSVWLYRPNCAGGRFYHHRPDDDLSRVSPEAMARAVRAVGRWLQGLTTVPKLPFARRIPPAMRREAARYWRELF